MSLAPSPRSVARLSGKIRVAASENAGSCLGQRIQQICWGELTALKQGGDRFTEKAETILLRDQYEGFTDPQNCDRSAGVEAQLVAILLGNGELSLLADPGVSHVFDLRLGERHIQTPGKNILPRRPAFGGSAHAADSAPEIS
jgi:hypothetical protein